MNKPNVVNLHFIDHCNYSCRYCFVKKESKMLSLENIKIIINNIKRLIYCIKNPQWLSIASKFKLLKI